MSKNKQRIFLLIGLFIFGVIGAVFWKTSGAFKDETDKNKEASPSYSMAVVYDGNHYKINHPIHEKSGSIFLSLPDLKAIITAKAEEKGEQLIIAYGDETLTYKNKTVQNSTAKKDEISQYEIKDGIVYIPDRHIEKYLGIKTDFFYNEKTKTVSLMSPAEQKKERVDQEIGSTIFLHKKNVPLEKFEPRGGIYLGGYVLQDEYINKSMENFNRLTGKQHASYFRYVGYGKPFPKEWAEEVIAAGGFPQIAWEPNNGLEEVQDDAYLRQFAKEAGQIKAPILLRYASEMNGTWTFYSGHSELYIKKWKLVHGVMAEEAPNVMMLWNVFTMPESTINDFYPGDDYVDYVGVNIYNVVYHNDKIEEKAEFEDPLRLLDYVYNMYSHKKPIVIGEYGATNYTVTDGLQHVDFAVEKIGRMYKYLPEIYPRVKFIYYFDVNNLINAPEGRKINNYAITENERIINAYADHVKSNQYLTGVQKNPADNETYSYRDFFFYYQGKIYADSQFFKDYLHVEVKEKDKHIYTVTYNEKSMEVTGEDLMIDKASYYQKRKINGLPLIDILDAFSIAYKYKDGNLHIYQ